MLKLGKPISSLGPVFDMEKAMRGLQAAGAPYDIKFGPPTIIATFIVNEKQKIVGAQPYAVFQRALQAAQQSINL